MEGQCLGDTSGKIRASSEERRDRGTKSGVSCLKSLLGVRLHGGRPADEAKTVMRGGEQVWCMFPLPKVKVPLPRKAVANLALGSNAFELYFFTLGRKRWTGISWAKRCTRWKGRGCLLSSSSLIFLAEGGGREHNVLQDVCVLLQSMFLSNPDTQKHCCTVLGIYQHWYSFLFFPESLWLDSDLMIFGEV